MKRNARKFRLALTTLMVLALLSLGVLAPPMAMPVLADGPKTFTFPDGSATSVPSGSYGGYQGTTYPVIFDIVGGTPMAGSYVTPGGEVTPGCSDCGSLADYQGYYDYSKRHSGSFYSGTDASNVTLRITFKDVDFTPLWNNGGGQLHCGILNSIGGGPGFPHSAQVVGFMYEPPICTRCGYDANDRKYCFQPWQQAGSWQGSGEGPDHCQNCQDLGGPTGTDHEYDTHDIVVEYVPVGDGTFRMYVHTRKHKAQARYAGGPCDDNGCMLWKGQDYNWGGLNRFYNHDDVLRSAGYNPDNVKVFIGASNGTAHPGLGGRTVTWSNVVVEGTPAAPSEVWVDDNWTGYSNGDPADGHTFGYDAFATIQDGIDAVAGSTVNVAAGTYDEVVAVNKSVNILGANAGVCAGVDPGTRGDESIVNAFHITANSVVVNGFQIEGAKVGGSGDATNAIVLDGGTSGHTISNNILPGPGGTPPAGTDRGIVFGYTISNTTVACNEIYGWMSGIYINPTNPGSNLLFQYNSIHDNWAGIGSSGLNDVSILNNNFSNNFEGFGSDTVGVNVVVHFNNFTDNEAGVNWYSGNNIDAEYNWWGSIDGPEDTDGGTSEVPPCAAVADMLNAIAEISGSLGDKVSDNVDYCPWLISSWPYVEFAQFTIDHAKLDFKKKPDDDKVRVQGKLKLDLDNGDGVKISEDVIVTVGSFSETIPGGTMVEKGKKGEKWEYKRPKGESGIKHMEIHWKDGEAKFDIRVDKAELGDISDWTNPVTISIQIGDDVGSESIPMKVHKHHLDYKYKNKMGKKTEAAEIEPVAITDPLKVVAYPNPIRDVDTATFQVMGTLATQVEEIRVQIYDLSGRLVWEDTALGSELDWHTNCLSGDYLANGIYLYSVQVRIGGNWINQDIGKVAVLR